MVLLATLAAAAAATQPAPPAAPQRQARATVQILKAARVSLGDPQARTEEAEVRTTAVRDEGEAVRQALLTEFY